MKCWVVIGEKRLNSAKRQKIYQTLLLADLRITRLYTFDDSLAWMSPCLAGLLLRSQDWQRMHAIILAGIARPWRSPVRTMCMSAKLSPSQSWGTLQMRLSVIGCGHLGAVHAACMAEIGHDVLGVDIDGGKIALLNSGKSWFHEPSLDELLFRNVAAGRLRFTTNVAEATEFGNVHFLGVATPGRPDGTYDLSQVNAAVVSLARHLHGPCLVVGKSTVPPGSAASLRAIAANVSPTRDVDIAWNPEFLREGCAVQDTLMPDRIVIGTASDSAEAILREIYYPLTASGIQLIVTDLATAELVKGAANAFLATKISFINVMADICAAVNGDVRALADALGLDPRIGQSFLKAGIGYGGGCLPKDVRGLAAFADGAGAHYASKLLMLVDAINVARRERVIRMVQEVVTDGSVSQQSPDRPLTGKRVAVLGASFKPGTDDIRDSPGLDIAGRLDLLGAQVTIYDPMATGNSFAAFPEFAYADSVLAAAEDADVVLLAVAWPEFAEISPVAARVAAASMTVVDACQAIDVVSWERAGWNVLSLTGSKAGLSAIPQL
jgi:UDPglucose 6-dehydrogenase